MKYDINKIRNSIICGEALAELKKIPSESIDMTICSPPYWALRDYSTEPIIWDGGKNCDHQWQHTVVPPKHSDDGKKGSGLAGSKTQAQCQRTLTEYDFCRKCGAWKGSLGLEPTFQLYLKHLCDIFDEVKRVLKREGTCWVNMGDTYSGSGKGSTKDNFGCIQNKNRALISQFTASQVKKGSTLPDKCLVQIPARFAISMCDRGWILRADIIWHKTNSMPESVKDRPNLNYEHIFLFSKSRRYYYEQQFEPYKTESVERLDRGVSPTNKWIDGPDGQTRHTMNQPRLNRKTRIPPEMAEQMGSPRARYHRKGRRSNDPELGNRNFMPIKMPPIGGVRQTEGNVNPTYSGNRPEWTQHGRNLRSVWKIPTSPFPIDYCPKCDVIIKRSEIGEGLVHKACGTKIIGHFASFPLALLNRPIKAGCPKEVCKKCGKGRKKIYEKIGEPKYTEEGKPEGKERSKMKWHDSHPNYNPRWWSDFEEVGYSDCKCGAEFSPGIILDPFAGTCTTAVVARQLGRDFIMIELNPDYVKMGQHRLRQKILI